MARAASKKRRKARERRLAAKGDAREGLGAIEQALITHPIRVSRMPFYRTDQGTEFLCLKISTVESVRVFPRFAQNLRKAVGHVYSLSWEVPAQGVEGHVHVLIACQRKKDDTVYSSWFVRKQLAINEVFNKHLQRC